MFACKVVRYVRDSENDAELAAVRAISRGHHSNIVSVLDTWIEREKYTTTYYIKMELCDGDLTGFLNHRYEEYNHPLDSGEIWNIFRQIMSGIGYIHSQGMIHRDIKPKNSNFPKIKTKDKN